MARAPAMEVAPTTSAEKIREQADAYRNLETELTEKREATKETTGGKTAWRKTCSENGVDPVILAQAVDLMMRVERDAEKTTREWRLLVGYLRGLGFFERLEKGLFDAFEEDVAASLAA